MSSTISKSCKLNFARAGALGALLFSVMTMRAAPLANFPFNEGTGRETTDTVAGLLGVLGDGIDPAAGPSWTNDSPAEVEGDFSLAFNLDYPEVQQSWAYVDLSASPFLLGANNTNYTLQAWVKIPTRLNTDRMVVYRTTGPGPRVSLSIHHNRTLHTTVYGNTDFTSSVVVPNDNRWHHVAVVMENDFGRVRFYLDGISRQTVNRTATGNPSDSGSPSLVIGMESSNRYYTGLLDRVRIDDTSLPVEELDYPAVAGLATFTSLADHPSPSSAVVDIGSTVSFQATPMGEATLHWLHREHLSDMGGTVLPDAVMAIPRVNLVGVTPADRGFYSLVVSNSAGEAESYSARLEVRTAPGTLEPLWTILPGEREYVTEWNSAAANRDLERGMAYNPVTDHLLIGSRIDSPTIRGIFIIDAETGAHVGELAGSSAITGGTIVLTRVVVADDGAIYACNFGTLSDTNPLKIYRWASETEAGPTIAYEGNPVSGITGNQQWGKNMVVRGSGVNTEILMDTRNVYLAHFTTTDGETFFPTIIQSDAFDDVTFGLAWGEGNTFWGKAPNESLYQWDLNAAEGTATMKQQILDYPGDSFMNFSFSDDRKYLAGLNVQAGPDSVELYDFSDSTKAPVLLDTAEFAVDNNHTVAYGNVLISSNRVFALNPNNGIMALSIVPPDTGLRPTLSIELSGNVILSWPASFEGFVLEATPSLDNPDWQAIPHQLNGEVNSAVVEPVGMRFFRLRK